MTAHSSFLMKNRDRISTSGGCWLWLGAKIGKGYANAWHDGRSKLVHRIVWEEVHGPIPRGMLVCHHCDIRHCVNPDHLFIGTNADNMADMARKGRSSSSPGEKNPRALVTAEQVIAIREDGRTLREIGAEYGLSKSAVSAIRRGVNWKGLETLYDEQRAAIEGA